MDLDSLIFSFYRHDAACYQHHAEDLPKPEVGQDMGEERARGCARYTRDYHEGDGGEDDMAAEEIDGNGRSRGEEKKQQIRALGGKLRKIGENREIDGEKASAANAES